MTHLLKRLFCFFCIVFIVGCSGKVPPEAIRLEMQSNNIPRLIQQIESKGHQTDNLDVALNLARLYQLDGQWQNSLKTTETALAILEEYEQRAIVNLREIGSTFGEYILARGTQGYYGTGFERSLMHTFNAINYLMLDNLDGATVELRKMEYRQELWLQECAIRTEQCESLSKIVPTTITPAYSMHKYLEEVRERPEFHGYQEPFSYTLSAYLNALSGNTPYAEISAKRAAALSPAAKEMLRAWPPKIWAGNRTQGIPTLFIVTSGIAPSIYIERMRIPMPAIGYLTIDLPAYMPPVSFSPSITIQGGEKNISPVPLLYVDYLTFKNLEDQLPYEIASAISRSLVKAGTSVAVNALLQQSDKTKEYAEVGSILTTLLLDLGTLWLDDSVRNWETLPNNGALAVDILPYSSPIQIQIGNNEISLTTPDHAKAFVVVIFIQTFNAMQVYHATIH